MDPTHVHLVITHLPIFGILLGVLALAYGTWFKSRHTQIMSYLLLVISSAGGAVAYFTGEFAEEAVEHLQGISKDLIEQHEESAGVALAAIVILGIASLAGIFIASKSKRASFANKFAAIAIVIGVISFGFVAYTGYLGGKIRHTELNIPSGTLDRTGE